MAKKPDELISFPMRLPRDAERLFDEIVHRPWAFCREIRGWNPSLDLYETADAFFLEADLPGVQPDDVKVDIENHDLVLRGWRSLERDYSDGQFRTMERGSGNFTRRMELPESIDREAIKAEFQDGVLRVIIPKAKQTGGAK